MVAGSCLPRSVLYTHYQDFCKKNHMDASSAASFGKVAKLSYIVIKSYIKINYYACRNNFMNYYYYYNCNCVQYLKLDNSCDHLSLQI